MTARAARFTLVLLLLAYLRWLAPSVAPYAGSADASGYLWSARLLRSGQIARPIDPGRLPLDDLGPSVFAPLGATVRPGTRELVPTYPVGLPLHIALVELFVSEERAVRAVLLGATAAVLWLMYRLGRQAGLARAWAAAAAALLACSPLFLFMAVQPMSDVLATAWVEGAVFFAWRAGRRSRYALAAGAALGIAVLVRPTNMVITAAVLAALPFTARHLFLGAAGLLPPAAFLAVYQAASYGHPLASGYGDVTTAFSWQYVLPSLAHYGRWLPALFSPLVAAATLAWWGWRGEFAPWRRVAITWATAVFGTYACYYHTAETWWYLRFVLPGMPALMLAALTGLQATLRWTAPPSRGFALVLARRASPALAAALVVVALALQGSHPLFDAHRQVRPDERIYQAAIAWMLLDGGATAPVLMVQLSGAANYYAPGLRFVRYDRLAAQHWTAIREWQRRTGRAVRAALAPFERDELFGRGRTRLPCEWRPRGTFRWVSFWECPAPR